MPKNKDLIKSAKIRKSPDTKGIIEKGADFAKKNIDQGLVDYVTKPLSAAGYPKTGAVLGALGSATADFFIPSSFLEIIPYNKIGKAVKGVKSLGEFLERVPNKNDKAKILAKALDEPKMVEEATEKLKKMNLETLDIISSKVPMSKEALNRVKVVQNLKKDELEKATTAAAKELREKTDKAARAAKRNEHQKGAGRIEKMQDSGQPQNLQKDPVVTKAGQDAKSKSKNEELLDQVNLTNTGKNIKQK